MDGQAATVKAPALPLRRHGFLALRGNRPRFRSDPRYPDGARRGRGGEAAAEELVILVDLYRHGHFDSSAYQSYLAGELEDFEMPELKREAALEHLPEVPASA